jgi:hypothetical protein
MDHGGQSLRNSCAGMGPSLCSDQSGLVSPGIAHVVNPMTHP